MQEMDEEEELERERERKSGKFRDHDIGTVRVKDWFFAEQEMAGRKSWRSKGERVREVWFGHARCAGLDRWIYGLLRNVRWEKIERPLKGNGQQQA